MVCFTNSVDVLLKGQTLLIKKPLHWSSFDVVKKIRCQIKPSKVGHAGTLDPFAEGVLMLCTGKFTKKVESFMNKEKEYITDQNSRLLQTFKIRKNKINA